jgi:hypothetical protein
MPPVLTSGALRGSERAVMTSSSLPVTPPTTAIGVALHHNYQLFSCGHQEIGLLRKLLVVTGFCISHWVTRETIAWLRGFVASRLPTVGLPFAAAGSGRLCAKPVGTLLCADSRRKLPTQSAQVRPSAICACSLVEGLAVAGAGPDEEQIVQQVALEDLLVQIQCILQHYNSCVPDEARRRGSCDTMLSVLTAASAVNAVIYKRGKHAHAASDRSFLRADSNAVGAAHIGGRRPRVVVRHQVDEIPVAAQVLHRQPVQQTGHVHLVAAQVSVKPDAHPALFSSRQ